VSNSTIHAAATRHWRCLLSTATAEATAAELGVVGTGGGSLQAKHTASGNTSVKHGFSLSTDCTAACTNLVQSLCKHFICQTAASWVNPESAWPSTAAVSTATPLYLVATTTAAEATTLAGATPVSLTATLPVATLTAGGPVAHGGAAALTCNGTTAQYKVCG
jgi:hypothetical protein